MIRLGPKINEEVRRVAELNRAAGLQGCSRPTAAARCTSSHGESFLALVTNRFRPEGLYILDEPEAALSLPGNLALLKEMHDLVEQGAQFIVVTHSPILMGYPEALIYALDEEGFAQTAWEDTEHYQLTS